MSGFYFLLGQWGLESRISQIYGFWPRRHEGRQRSEDGGQENLATKTRRHEEKAGPAPRARKDTEER